MVSVTAVKQHPTIFLPGSSTGPWGIALTVLGHRVLLRSFEYHSVTISPPLWRDRGTVPHLSGCEWGLYSDHKGPLNGLLRGL